MAPDHFVWHQQLYMHHLDYLQMQVSSPFAAYLNIQMAPIINIQKIIQGVVCVSVANRVIDRKVGPAQQFKSTDQNKIIGRLQVTQTIIQRVAHYPGSFFVFIGFIVIRKF